jgi:hypothetical protein
MTPKRLHSYLKASLQGFPRRAESEGLRSLVEATGAENFLTGLLFIQLHAVGLSVSREFPLGNRCAADVVVHGSRDLYIETKELHLKDGCRFAPQNLANDLARHRHARTLGIIYIADERSSTTDNQRPRFRGANRRAKTDVPTVLAALREFFPVVFPRTAEGGVLRKFTGNGGVDLYGFVVNRAKI